MMIQSPFRDYYDYVGDGTHTFPIYERTRVVDVSHLGIINTMHSVLPSSTNLSSGYLQGMPRKLSKSTPRLHVSYTHKNTKYRFREVCRCLVISLCIWKCFIRIGSNLSSLSPQSSISRTTCISTTPIPNWNLQA